MLHKRAWLLVMGLGLGCVTGNPYADYHETPVIERGACATVIMPGEQVPLGSQPDCPNGYSSIGGAVVYDEKDYEKPLTPKQVAKSVVGAPAAVVGAPVAAGAAAVNRMRNGQQQSSSRSGSAEQPASEEDVIEQMRREIVQREAHGRGQAEPAQPAPAAQPGRVASHTSPAPSASIAAELAALRGARADAPAPVSSAPAPLAPRLPPQRSAPAPTAPVADRVADRDGDGAPDQWIYRDASGRPAREELDENADARPDRTSWLDPATGRETRMEEDSNLDGRVDTWVEYTDGAMARQRRDTNYDGVPDVWSYYDRAGQLSRQELDLDGDGYRNRESLYRGGKLAKEREDRDGDGRFDLVTAYDADERIARRDEDRDGDGRIDTRSIYQAGKLAKREVVTEAIDDGDDLSQTEW
ncbi:MAG: hypothetical protein ACHQ6V_09255 [Myxococcota bacterium]